MRYVPTCKDSNLKFKQRMIRYAQLVGAPIPRYEGISDMPYVFPAAKTPQDGTTTPLRCSISPTSPSLQNIGFSNASINTRPIEVVEEGLDHPSYYGPYIRGE